MFIETEWTFVLLKILMDNDLEVWENVSSGEQLWLKAEAARESPQTTWRGKKKPNILPLILTKFTSNILSI